MTYQVSDPRQSIFDVTVQNCGTVEQLFAFLDLNGLDINSDLFPGKVVQVVTDLPDRAREVVDYFAERKLKIVNSLQAASPNLPPEDFDARDFDNNDFYAG
jgi:hypothetical protein